MRNTFHVSNFGCRASQSEGASIQQELVDSEAVESPSAYDADVVIVNSCTVTDEADRQVRQMIRRIASRNPSVQIIVTGCYAQRAPEELTRLPQVRYVVGNSHKLLVPQLTLNLFDQDFSSHGRAEILCSSIFLEKELDPHAYLGSGGRTRAVVKIQDGCNANCSFCIIPTVRGRSRSLAPNVVLDEVRELVSRGYKEVVFSGIHLGTYGRDLDPRTSFFDLLCKTVHIEELQRLRLSSIEPLELVPEIVELAAGDSRIARHFHIPLQSGSARVLRAMRRPYSPRHYTELVAGIRARIPGAAIGADVMVGFPGESDEDFQATYRLIEESPLTYLHVFPFSVRPDTAAAEMRDRVPEHVARFRAKALRQLIAQKNEQFRRGMIGKEMKVLVLEDGSALSDNFIRIEIPPHQPVNRWIRTQVTGLTDDGLRADPLIQS
jgi:threonylcarbamoyladenosine tRNA methylthiotransferase MtaB